MAYVVDFDPVIVQIGPVALRWYGTMYLVGFVGAWWLGRVRAQRYPDWGWQPREIGDLLFYVALGVVLGGRLGYVLFYDFAHFLDDPLRLVKIWEGGMAFHGGLLGVILAMALYGRRTGRGFFEVADFIAPLVPIGLAAGRLGNFINGELWGRPSDLPWAMIFPNAGDVQPRHPSQLYEFLLEGVVLFAVLWLYSRRRRPTMAVSGMFLLLYGGFRFGVEFVREPDRHIGYLAWDWLTMGQVLSLPMIVLGAVFLSWGYARARSRP
jgi:phosphatidylglycerol:prolipoprotein diacylglycerol transferase